MTNKKWKSVLARNMRRMLKINWDLSLKLASIYSKNEILGLDDLFKAMEEHDFIIEIVYDNEDVIDVRNTVIRYGNLFCSLWEFLNGEQDENFNYRRVYRVIYSFGAYEDYYESSILNTHILEKALQKKNEEFNKIQQFRRQCKICEKCILHDLDNIIESEIVEKEKCDLYKPYDGSQCCKEDYDYFDDRYDAEVEVVTIEIQD